MLMTTTTRRSFIARCRLRGWLDMPGDPRKVTEAMIRIGNRADPQRRQLLG
jgi:hypothetical protein